MSSLVHNCPGLLIVLIQIVLPSPSSIFLRRPSGMHFRAHILTAASCSKEIKRTKWVRRPNNGVSFPGWIIIRSYFAAVCVIQTVEVSTSDNILSPNDGVEGRRQMQNERRGLAMAICVLAAPVLAQPYLQTVPKVWCGYGLSRSETAPRQPTDWED